MDAALRRGYPRWGVRDCHQPERRRGLQRAGLLHYVGRSEEALGYFERAMALNPLCPGMWLHFQGQAYYQLQRYEEAENVLKRRIFRNPETDASRALLAATYGQTGRLDEAREQWREVLRVNPDYSLEHRRKVLPYKRPADFETVVDGLRKAGLVEEVGRTGV
jgi:adenylate cyclase